VSDDRVKFDFYPRLEPTRRALSKGVNCHFDNLTGGFFAGGGMPGKSHQKPWRPFGMGTMSGYRKRQDRIDDPGPLLGRIRVIREELVRTTRTVKPFGVVHHALSMVVVAIDGLATVLTGEQFYFMGVGSTVNEGALVVETEKLAQESGES
jgi:hypothetical protein